MFWIVCAHTCGFVRLHLDYPLIHPSAESPLNKYDHCVESPATSVDTEPGRGRKRMVSPSPDHPFLLFDVSPVYVLKKTRTFSVVFQHAPCGDQRTTENDGDGGNLLIHESKEERLL